MNQTGWRIFSTSTRRVGGGLPGLASVEPCFFGKAAPFACGGIHDQATTSSFSPTVSFIQTAKPTHPGLNPLRSRLFQYISAYHSVPCCGMKRLALNQWISEAGIDRMKAVEN